MRQVEGARAIPREGQKTDEPTKAYIAGFLDGDGSIMFQLVPRKGYVFGYQIRASVCFYQNTFHKEGLLWLKDRLGAGYIRDRAGNVSDLTIVGCDEVARILSLVEHYVVFKKKHVVAAREILAVLKKKLSPSEFLQAAKMVDEFATLNYSKKKVNNAECVRRFMDSKGILAPVTTSPNGEMVVTVKGY